MTFGRLRAYHQDFVVECRRCGHSRTFTHKQGRFLKERLPDEMALAAATLLFRCTECNWHVVRVTPAPLDPKRVEAGRQ
jgi:DNA-directed RNA polymerase subunit RPC12/RpoP